MSRSQKWRQEWSFFIGDSGRRKYDRFCVRCVHSCKQSFRADLIACPHFSRKASRCRQLGVEKACDSSERRKLTSLSDCIPCAVSSLARK